MANTQFITKTCIFLFLQLYSSIEEVTKSGSLSPFTKIGDKILHVKGRLFGKCAFEMRCYVESPR